MASSWFCELAQAGQGMSQLTVLSLPCVLLWWPWQCVLVLLEQPCPVLFSAQV